MEAAPCGRAVLGCLCITKGDCWCNRYITEADLQFFKDRVEGAGEVKGAGPWEHMVTKDFGNFTYEAFRRWLPVGAGLPNWMLAPPCSCIHREYRTLLQLGASGW